MDRCFIDCFETSIKYCYEVVIYFLRLSVVRKRGTHRVDSFLIPNILCKYNPRVLSYSAHLKSAVSQYKFIDLCQLAIKPTLIIEGEKSVSSS